MNSDNSGLREFAEIVSGNAGLGREFAERLRLPGCKAAGRAGGKRLSCTLNFGHEYLGLLHVDPRGIRWREKTKTTEERR